MFPTKVCRENQNPHFMLNNSFISPKIVR